VDGDEWRCVQELLESCDLIPGGEKVSSFERHICGYTGAAHCAAVSSGTAALHLALLVLGVQADDEVICQSFTFAATAFPIKYIGATPIFIDSETETWNMEPGLLKEAIEDRMSKGKKPKVIIPIHVYGMPAKIQEIMEIAGDYDIPIIEDAAEAFGSSYNGQKMGTFGDLGVYSFNGNKIITTSGGGALISSNNNYIKRAKYLAAQARSEARHYEHHTIGYNYQMSNVSAAIGIGQIKRLEEKIVARKRNFEFYRENLENIGGIEFLNEPGNTYSNQWLTTLLINPALTSGIDAEMIRLALENENIEARSLWKPMHRQEVFKGAPFYGNGNADKLFNEGLSLPSGSNLGLKDLKKVVKKIKNVLKVT